MQITKPTFYKEFSCIAGACPDTCCAGWEIEVDETTAQGYLAEKGAFGDRLRREIGSEPGEYFFKLQNNRCPFLNKENLCDIFINIGEDKLCTVCTEYPRFTETYGSLTEKGLGMSCESAAEFIFKSEKPTGFETEKFDYEEECDEDF